MKPEAMHAGTVWLELVRLRQWCAENYHDFDAIDRDAYQWVNSCNPKHRSWQKHLRFMRWALPTLQAAFLAGLVLLAVI